MLGEQTYFLDRVAGANGLALGVGDFVSLLDGGRLVVVVVGDAIAVGPHQSVVHHDVLRVHLHRGEDSRASSS